MREGRRKYQGKGGREGGREGGRAETYREEPFDGVLHAFVDHSLM